MKDTFAFRLALFIVWPFAWAILLPALALTALLSWPLVLSKRTKITWRRK